MSADDDTDDTQDGSQGNGELKGRMQGLNSPFGLIGQLKEKRGYTHKQVMWGQSWLMYMLELADQPRYTRKQEVITYDNTEQIKEHLGTGRNRHNDATECE